jgi:uncharacterized membrane protein YeiH
MPLYCYFLLTLLIEMPIVLWAWRQQWKQALIIGCLLNLFTWPILIVLYHETTINLNLLELGVFIAEGAGYSIFMKGRPLRAFIIAFVVNALSYGIGEIINYYFIK